MATILSVFFGGALTLLSTWLADGRLTKREQKRRQEELSDRRAIRRDDFQRDTLLALQNAAQKLARAIGAMHFQDVISFRNTGVWQKQQFSDDLSLEELSQKTETMLLASRVRDAEVRDLANKLCVDSSAIGFSANEIEAQNLISGVLETQKALIERIGVLVRELDETH